MISCRLQRRRQLIDDTFSEVAWYCRAIRIMTIKSAEYKIVSRNITLHDAVSNFAVELADFLNKQNRSAQLYAQDVARGYQNMVRPVSLLSKELEIRDTLFCNYSIYDEFFETYIDIPCAKKVLYFHNVTPGIFFRDYDPSFADLLDAARTQYPLFSAFDAVLANSRYSLEQIRPYVRKDIPCGIFPPYFTLAPSAAASTTPVPLPAARHALLWVGRITPHKRPDLALAVFDELVRSGVDASLTFVGGGRYDFPGFAAHMDACLARLEPTTRERVRFLQDLSDEQLTWLYRNTALLLCTSAHEGYCMPPAEAAVCGLPVAAMPQPAVLETLNGGGIVLEEEPAAAARRIKAFLTGADEAERRRAVPVLKPLPTDELVRLVTGDARCR